MSKTYETVIGLEVHVELATASKIFCACSTAFGAPPNSQCCPVCSGMPGALPVLNRKAVEYAVLAGLATHCAIAAHSKCDRKHYFYPDLPKAYQISQFDEPLCSGGYLSIHTPAGEKRVGITRIHIEEDAGKLIHTAGGETLIDLNRCGVPLIEVVSAPDLRSAEEAVAYLKKLHAIVLYLGISDGRMNEGSFRCDINLSLREAGSTALGTRTEIKNLNSFAFAAAAIRHEAARQAALLDAGQEIVQETLRFDTKTGKTHSMRSKESAGDYRFFPEPDLPAFAISKAEIAALRQGMPMLPDERRTRYEAAYGLSPQHSEALVLNKPAADLFEAAAPLCRDARAMAMLVITEVFHLMDAGGGVGKLSPEQLAQTANLLAEGHVNGQGAKALLAHLWQNGGDAAGLVHSLDLGQIQNEDALAATVAEVLAENPGSAADYRAGKQAALKALMGAAMKKTGGRGNPRALERLLREKLGG